MAYWFRGKELSTAFGITITSCRIGSVANFFITPTISERYSHLQLHIFKSQQITFSDLPLLRFSLSCALWVGVALCVIGFFAAVVVTSMDSYGVRKLGQSDVIKEQHKRRSVRDVTLLRSEFWLILLALSAFYGSFMPFVQNSVCV